MGFKAINQDGEAIYSFNLNNSEWQNIKSNHNKLLKMNCCNAIAIPKNSKYGIQFFAHKANGCGVNESIEHQFIKYLCLTALKNNGWMVDTEVRFNNGDDVFIADVYAEKGSRKLAIEVQWSPIDSDVLEKRHDKYTRAGIKCIWLCRTAPFGDSFHKPIFNINILNKSELVLSGIFDFKEKRKRNFSIDEFIEAVTVNKINKIHKVGDFFSRLEYRKFKCKKCNEYTAFHQKYKHFVKINDLTCDFYYGDCIEVLNPYWYQVDNLPCMHSNVFICGHCGYEKPKTNGFSTILSKDIFQSKLNSVNSMFDYWVYFN